MTGFDRDHFAVVEKTRELIETNRALRAVLAQTRARSREVAISKLFPLHGAAEGATRDEASLRQRVRAFLRSGLLPAASPEVWAGVGTGALCAVCGVVISFMDVEYEVARDGHRVFAHLPCFMMWREETARHDWDGHRLA